jgi:hypothetical protein
VPTKSSDIRGGGSDREQLWISMLTGMNKAMKVVESFAPS